MIWRCVFGAVARSCIVASELEFIMIRFGCYLSCVFWLFFETLGLKVPAIVEGGVARSRCLGGQLGWTIISICSTRQWR